MKTIYSIHFNFQQIIIMYSLSQFIDLIPIRNDNCNICFLGDCYSNLFKHPAYYFALIEIPDDRLFTTYLFFKWPIMCRNIIKPEQAVIIHDVSTILKSPLIECGAGISIVRICPVRFPGFAVMQAGFLSSFPWASACTWQKAQILISIFALSLVCEGSER